ncbi:DUF4430 domain-containing protein [bacterium LRH843]|nr:DUF4430 domain-containing protein [bacterium LRH843]
MISKRWNKLLALCLTFLILFSVVSPTIVGAVDELSEETGKKPEEALESLVDYYKHNQPSSPGSLWEAFVGLWGAGENLGDSPWQEYQWDNLNFEEKTTSNDHIYYIFSLLSVGKNPVSAGATNRNLFKELASHQAETGSFGTFGKHIYAMIALDVGVQLGVDVGTWNDVSREKAVAHLIRQQQGDGSFGPFSKVDYTGWALIVLSNFTGEKVEESITKAKQYLKGEQEKLDNGDFKGEGQNSSSLANAIQGLVAIGEDLYSSEGHWAVNGKTPVDALLEYQKEDGSFRWVLGADHSIGMATKQVAIALADIVNKQSTWYKLGEIKLGDETNEAPEIVNKEALQEAVAKAVENKDAVKVSEEGTNVDKSLSWVTEAEMNAYVEAILSAQVLLDEVDATKVEVDAKTLALNQATNTFNEAKKVGTDTENPPLLVELRVDGLNGPILANQKIEVTAGETALELLQRVLEGEKINYDIRESSWGSYIAKINGEKEATLGGWDGWAFKVNGVMPQVGADTYYLENSDEVQFYYSRWAAITSPSLIEEGKEDPTVTVSLVGDEFTEEVAKTANWSIDVGATKLKVDTIEKVTDQKISIHFTGEAKSGAISIQALEGAVKGENPSDGISVKVIKNVDNSNELEIDENETEVYIQTEATKSLTLEFSKKELPIIQAERGNIVLDIPTSTTVSSEDWDKKLQLPTTLEPNNSNLRNKINSTLQGKEVSEIALRLKVGGNKQIKFNQHVTLTLKGLANKTAGFVDEDGNFELIEKFEMHELPNDKDVYAYDDYNGDLIIKTQHFTEFLAFKATLKEAEEPNGDNGSGNGNGSGGTPSSKPTITLSIDKKTINKGYVLQPTKVEFTPGESVWDVLKRELDRRDIDYTHSFSGEYGSVYIESIAGDGELDNVSGSGWKYNVNGTYPNYGASQYILKVGDKVEWRYTANLGVDLGEDPSELENKPTPGGGSTNPTTTLPVNPKEKNPIINVPSSTKEDYVVKVSKDAEKVSINMPSADVKLSLNLGDVKDKTPLIEVKKGDKVFTIAKGTKLSSGRSTIDVFTNVKNQQQKITNVINESLVNEKSTIVDAFEMGSSSSSTLFDQPVTLALEGQKGKNVGFIDAKGKWSPIPIYESEIAGEEASKDSKEKTYAFAKGNDLIVKTNHFTTFVLYTTEEIKEVKLEEIYSDAKAISPWAYDLMKEATEKGFVEGFAGKVNPKANVTRAEFAKLMVSVLGLDVEKDKVIQFKDVKESDWFYPYVNTAYIEKIVLGYDGKFLPNEKITREEMAAMIVRVLGIEDAKSNIAYKDSDRITPWAKPYVNAISSLNLMEGYNNQFEPKEVATREMAIVVAMRAYHYKNEK